MNLNTAKKDNEDLDIDKFYDKYRRKNFEERMKELRRYKH